VWTLASASADSQVPLDDAWRQLPQYAHGQDIAPLLSIERAVIESMASPESRAAMAQKLSEVLGQNETSAAAQQFICLQLRQVGTAAQVPQLSSLLATPEKQDMALAALASIPGAESTQVLRDALKTLPYPALIVAIDAAGSHQDVGSIESLKKLMTHDNRMVRMASLHALSRMTDPGAIEFVCEWALQQDMPWSADVAGCMLQIVRTKTLAREMDAAKSLLGAMAVSAQSSSTQRAALGGSLNLLEGEARNNWIVASLTSENAQARMVAAAHLRELPDEIIAELLSRLSDFSDDIVMLLIESSAERRNLELLPLCRTLLGQDTLNRKLAGVRILGRLGDPAVIPDLIALLAAEQELSAAASQALLRMPREAVGPALLAALSRSELCTPAIQVLREMKYYEAIDPLVERAASKDRNAYLPALAGLAGIADPDDADLPRLFGLLSRTAAGAHRDEVEKTIAQVCNKLPEGTSPAQPVLAWLKEHPTERLVLSLPLLGRLGGPESLTAIEAELPSKDPSTADAALRGLCNWPTAEVADKLSSLAVSGADKRTRRRALRAYVRVVSLPSQRPESDTLTMLQTAMKQAEEPEDRTLVLERAATVRTMECIRWLASFLDDPACAQQACQSLVELAHHRELRHPNIAEVGPILEKVATISKDSAIAERANRYRLGL
jgi:HEAT repeat protein